MKKIILITILFGGLFFIGATQADAQILKSVCPDLNKQPCVTAKEMLLSAKFFVLGSAEEPGYDWTKSAEAYLQGTYGVGNEQTFKNGLKLKDAVEFWKAYAASPMSGDGTAMKITHRAFNRIYGTTPETAERKMLMDAIKQKKTWYIQIYTEQLEKLNNSPELRKKMINHSYWSAMGRNATQAELDYWMPRKPHFEQLFKLTRTYIYSEAGKTDRTDMLTRVLTKMNGKAPTSADISIAFEKYAPNKRTYWEILTGKANELDLG